jgi:tetratricopeptide (TPR) repeat protein
MIRLTYPIVIGLALLVAPLASAARKEPKVRHETESKEAKLPVDTAAKDPAKESKERAAKKACLTGDPVKGVELLTDLFIDTNDPTYIFNQGRCYEQSNRYEEAIGRFREYLRKAKSAPAAERAEAEKHIADCQALSEKKESPMPAAGGGDSAGSAAGHGGSIPPPSSWWQRGQRLNRARRVLACARLAW